ncbi:MAG: phosphodiester glycosidase family protein, partial [Chitinophagia bacterium]|nr:phosphodiester glycosidase family protein [Chitinophagia bacterium]
MTTSSMSFATAMMMKSLGCSHAVNLDGGGSTSMLVGGSMLIRPSASGTERAVVSVVMVKRK